MLMLTVDFRWWVTDVHGSILSALCLKFFVRKCREKWFKISYPKCRAHHMASWMSSTIRAEKSCSVERQRQSAYGKGPWNCSGSLQLILSHDFLYFKGNRSENPCKSRKHHTQMHQSWNTNARLLHLSGDYWGFFGCMFLQRGIRKRLSM